jgi:pyrroline-5-carboxylate reductase
MKGKKIAIIGCGNLGISIAHGLLSREDFDSNQLFLSRRDLQPLAHFQEQGVIVSTSNIDIAKEADIIVLGVKPFNVAHILQEIAPHLDPLRHVVVSLATGITLDEMLQHLPSQMRTYRAMPNIAADIRESITCICSRNTSPVEDAWVFELFDSVGKSIRIEENLMEAATVLGACGIAYVLRFMRAMIQGGIQIGFDAKTASAIVNQTVKGASEMMIQLQMHPEEAIDKVTTPKGCTIVGLNEMEHHGFSAAMVRGVLASYQKIEK